MLSFSNSRKMLMFLSFLLSFNKIVLTFFAIKTPFGISFLNLHFKISVEANHKTAFRVRDLVEWVWFGPETSPCFVQREAGPR